MTRRPRALHRACAAAVLTFAGASCGGDASDTAATTRPAQAQADPTDAPADPTDAPGGTAATASCAPTRLTFTNAATGTTGTAASALATADHLGSPLLAYAADHTLEPAAVSSFYPTVGAGQNVVLVQFTTLTGDPAPYEPGTELVWGEPGPTFLVIHAEGDQRFQTAAADQTRGTLALTAVTDDALCFEIDYDDGTVEVTGTVAAPIVAR